LSDKSRQVAGRHCSPAQAWWAVVVLATAYLLSFVDRTIINLLVGPIEQDLQINDTQFGALQGLAFGLFYSLAALPLGRLADSHNRRAIISAGLAFFTLFSILSGLAKTYSTLFLARMGVGVGEASLLPTSYSLLSDYFRANQLARAISVFTMGAFIGVGLSYIWGGKVIGMLADVDSVVLPLLGEMRPWQFTLILVATPGLLIIPLMFTLKEPLRRGASGGTAQIPLPIPVAFKEAWSRRKALGLMFAGFGIIALSGQASAVWTISVFIRAYSMPAQDIAPIYGLIFMGASIPGAFAGAWLCDKLTMQGVSDAPLKVAAWGFLGTGVFGALAPLMPTSSQALLMFIPAIALQSMMYPLAGTALQLMLPNRLRGQVTALYLIVLNVVGLGMGPMLVGMMTDYLFTEPSDVRYALAWVNAVCAPLSFMFLMWACGPYRKERIRMS
jgi:MFS family permease